MFNNDNAVDGSDMFNNDDAVDGSDMFNNDDALDGSDLFSDDDAVDLSVEVDERPRELNMKYRTNTFPCNFSSDFLWPDHKRRLFCRIKMLVISFTR